ncbi:tetratricopeptide repeat-containing sensor histidine kinase [Spirosoma sp.]|uniref:tetratricopeptide repeat-containing sensor histidine kinase n=1 Tax=Spirosoma sp. TaxID=1899569 RepID=UPI003B3BC7A4
MKSSQNVLRLFVCLLLSTSLQAQSYDTPPFDFDRRIDQHYVDSLLGVTRTRLLALDQRRPSPRVDTARMEYLHFLAYVHYSGITHRDSARLVTNSLIRLAEQKKNVKYQIKGLLENERYYRDFSRDYPQAIKLNYRLLALIDTSPEQYSMYLWRIYRNLGRINSSIGDYEEAVSYLQKSIQWFDKDKRNEPSQLASLHQYLADAYKGQSQLAKAETHYLLAWEIFVHNKASLSNKAYLLNDIGAVYSSQHKFVQAIPPLKQSVAYWNQLNSPLPQADALADLAGAYLGLGQYAEAITSAKEALEKNHKVHAPMLTAYSVLIKSYEHLKDWENAFAFQQLYNNTLKDQQQAINQSESLRIKAKYDRERLATAYQHEHQIQDQRYQTLAKQAEIDRLNHTFRTNELLQLAQTNTLKHQLETQRLKAVSSQKQTTINQLKIKQLRLGMSAQEDLRNLLLTGLLLISLLGLLLLYYSLRLRRTNVALQAKNREIEMALLKGQTIERKRVATELHDRVSSLLGATKMTFQTIDADGLAPRDKKLYESSLTLLDDAVVQVQQVSRNLIPEQLLQQDLLVSLKSLVKKLNLVDKTVFTLTDESAGKLPSTSDVKFNLYVICLELCTNILRHAYARNATIRLIGHDSWLAIQVNDDGIGTNHRREAGMGLHNIRERAQAIGAQFWIESEPENGTIARVLLSV